MKKTIVFITDCIDVAYNELRGVVISQLQKLGNNIEVEIEPVAPIKPFSIINGNFVLRLLADIYPEGTIFSIILNPLKERPARLIGKTKKKHFYFMGANTGVFEWFFRDFEIEELYELYDPGFVSFDFILASLLKYCYKLAILYRAKLFISTLFLNKMRQPSSVSFVSFPSQITKNETDRLPSNCPLEKPSEKPYNACISKVLDRHTPQ